MALERDEVWWLTLLFFGSSSKFEIPQFRETGWIEAFPCLPIRFPFLLCPCLPGGIWRGREVLVAAAPASREGREPAAAWPELPHRFRFSSLMDGKVGANSLRRSDTCFCLLCWVGLRYQSCHSSSNAWVGQERRCCSKKMLQYWSYELMRLAKPLFWEVVWDCLVYK